MRLPKLQADRPQGADPPEVRHPHRRADDRPARAGAAGSAGTARTGSVRGKADIRAGRAMVELAAGHDTAATGWRSGSTPSPTATGSTSTCASIAGRRAAAGAARHQAADRPDHRAATAAGRAWRGSRALTCRSARPPGCALGVRQRALRLVGSRGAGAIPQGQAAAADRAGGQGRRRRRLARRPGPRREADAGLAVASGGRRAARSTSPRAATARSASGVDLLRPPALFPNMTGRNVRMVWTLDGPYATARLCLSADLARRCSSTRPASSTFAPKGSGKLSPWPMRVPLRLTARAITGVGDVAGAILANARLEGMLTITPKFVRGEGLQLRSAKLNGKMSLLIDLVTGRFEIVISGGLTRYLIPGLGIVDVETELKVVPGPDGKGSRVVGTGQGLGPAARQQLLRRPDRRAAAARDRSRARATTASSISPTSSSIRPSFGCRGRGLCATATAPSTSSRAGGRRNMARCG